MKKRTLISIALGIVAIAGMAQTIPNGNPYRFHATQNPIITHKHTADPAPFVKGDTLYLYTGVDFAGNQGGYKMHEWALFTLMNSNGKIHMLHTQLMWLRRMASTISMCRPTGAASVWL